MGCRPRGSARSRSPRLVKRRAMPSESLPCLACGMGGKPKVNIHYWTLAFFAASRWLTQKALEYRQIIGQFRRLLTGRLQEGTRVFVAMLTHDVGHRTQAFLGWGMVHAPLDKCQGQKDHGEPLFRRFVGLHPKVGQAQMLFHIEVVYLNGPTLLIDRQDLLCR